MPRERIPTTLKLLRGNPGRRPLPKDEPQPALGAKPPAWLSEVARREWDRKAPMLEKLGVLTEADEDALATYCELFAAFQYHAKCGNTSARTAGEMRQYLAKFGMTPADRSRVSAKPKAEARKLDRFTGTSGPAR